VPLSANFPVQALVVSDSLVQDWQQWDLLVERPQVQGMGCASQTLAAPVASLEDPVGSSALAEERSSPAEVDSGVLATFWPQ
jgi:hypothetical protein